MACNAMGLRIFSGSQASLELSATSIKIRCKFPKLSAQPKASLKKPHGKQDAFGGNVAQNFQSRHHQRDNDGTTMMARKSFTPDDPALPMNYPGFVFRTLREEGYPADTLLAETGLDEAHFSDPRFRCSFEPLRRLFLNAIEQTGDPNLGLRLARQFQPTYIGMPSYTAMNAAHFREGLDVLTKFFFLNFPAFEVRLVDDDPGLQAGEAAIRLRSKFPFEDIEYFGSAAPSLPSTVCSRRCCGLITPPPVQR